MKETIYSIPINESFELQDGSCPVCRLHNRLIEDSLEYTLSPAMMEPDVRAKTNRRGFCPEHMALLLKRRNRLPLALVLETHLIWLIENPKTLSDGQDCYICDRVEGFLQAYYKNILYLWKTESDFRDKWYTQSGFCREHTAGLASCASKNLTRRESARFLAELQDKIKAELSDMSESLKVFIKSFDHRFTDVPLGEHAKSVERAAKFLGAHEQAPW